MGKKRGVFNSPLQGRPGGPPFFKPGDPPGRPYSRKSEVKNTPDSVDRRISSASIFNRSGPGKQGVDPVGVFVVERPDSGF